MRPAYLVPIAVLLLASGVYAARVPLGLRRANTSAAAELVEIGLPRTSVARLTATRTYRPCAAARAPAGGRAPIALRCPALHVAPEPSPAVAVALARATAGDGPDSRRALAMGDVTWSGSRLGPIRRAITMLEKDSASRPLPAAVFADLAAAYVAAAERTGSTLDLLHAVEAADRAVEADSASATARWNLAVALDMLTVDGEAIRAWDAYLAIDSTSPWAAEARARRDLLRQMPDAAPPPPARGATAEQLDAWAAITPQGARERGWDVLLPAWGAATLRGDSVEAARNLHEARVLGRALERRGLDATLADAVAAVDANRGARERRRLAQAHVRYGAGMRAYQYGNRIEALAPFKDAAAVGDLSPALTLWARLFHGMCGVYTSTPGARGEIAGVMHDADSLRTPALLGRALWASATAAARAAETMGAIEAYARATEVLTRAREPEYAAAMRMMHARSLYLAMRDTSAQLTQKALDALRPYPRSRWRHTQMQALAQDAGERALSRAALRVQFESLRTAELGGTSPDVVEGRTGLAEALLKFGRRAQADSIAHRAVPAGTRMDSAASAYFRNGMLALRALVAVDVDPRSATAALDSVMRDSAWLANADRAMRLYSQRAHAWNRAGDPARERADLAAFLAISERLRDSMSVLAARAEMADAISPEVNRLVILAIAAGQPGQALRYLERGRESFSRLPSTARQGPFVVPAGEVALDYAVVGDTLLVWIVRGHQPTLIRTSVDAIALRKLIRDTNEQLARGAGSPTIDTGLRRLHQILIAPLLGKLTPSDSTLVIVADGDVVAAPFAALRDSANGRYLIEDRILRFAPSLPTGVSARTDDTPRRVLVVADPALDRQANPGLPALPGARAEAADVMRVYPGASLLQGGSATSAAFLRALRSTEVVHYAGHAVFDEDRPAASYLALAPRAGDRDGRVTAAQVSRLKLDNVRLIVLSACRVSPSTNGRSGGFSGLAGALLYAGAGGAVGSQWEVDDARTHALMHALHSAYRQSGDGARALRSAQIALMKTADPRLTSPAGWAGFRMAGQ